MAYLMLVTGSVEVFQHPQDYDLNTNPVEGDEPLEPGWYWWACSPGCLPDGEAVGPFETEALAEQDAKGDEDDGPKPLPKLRQYFTNENPRKVWSLTGDAPEWLKDAVRDAHYNGAMQFGDCPNDWIYEECRAVCIAIEDGDFGDDIEALDEPHDALHEYADSRVDIYTKVLYQWQADMCQTDTYAYAEERLADMGSEGETGEKRVGALQYCAIEYIASTIISAVVAASEDE